MVFLLLADKEGDEDDEDEDEDEVMLQKKYQNEFWLGLKIQSKMVIKFHFKSC